MHIRAGIGVALAVVVLLSSGLASGEVYRAGNLRISFDGGFAPDSLPRDRPVPVTASVSGQIRTTDGSHPPSLRWLRLELNRSAQISTIGLPSCRPASLQSATSAAALARCQGALVGSGRFKADLGGSGTPILTRGRILVFNSTVAAKPALLLHLYGNIPIQSAYVVLLKIHRQVQGQYGTVLVAELPKLAGGAGSITDIELDIGREYGYRGERRGYLNASCAAPEDFNSVPFSFVRGSFRFVGGLRLATSLTRSCRVRG